jgi:hypothetical protein
MYKTHFGTPIRLQNIMLQNNVIVLFQYTLERTSYDGKRIRGCIVWPNSCSFCIIPAARSRTVINSVNIHTILNLWHSLVGSICQTTDL